jgi:MoaA/NifB/PqqE/SkfB family radical SAM enzyme
MNLFTVKRSVRAADRRVREWLMIAHGLLSHRHPVLAHIIPIRRCNLACAYCNEFDDFSKPVPTRDMIRRIDRLAALGTAIITISGGEPLLHPELEVIIRRIRERRMLAGMITNGYLLTPNRIEHLNRAGLDHLQISIDNILPDDVSKKSLKVLDKKLQMLARHALFGVNLNSVLGSSVRHPDDALTVARRARALGFTSTVGIIHDGGGQLKPLADRQQKIFDEIMALGRRSYSRFNRGFQGDIAHGRAHEWRCRAGGRYLYICEDGLVHYCSQQRGYPGIPLEQYTRAHLEHEYGTEKPCAPRCTVSCVHQISLLDNWRDPQTRRAFRPPVTATRPPVQVETPVQEPEG